MSVLASNVNQWQYRLAFSGGLAWSAYLLIRSSGATVDDEIAHFLLSQHALKYPELLLDLWGRPLNTLFYLFPAQLGWSAARWFSLLLSALSVGLTTAVARNSGLKHLFLVPLFLWFQPWFHLNGFEVITEVPFLFLLVLGVFLWQRNSQALAGIIFGLLPLVRHEGILLTGLWCLYALYRRRWQDLVPALLPLTLFNCAYYLVLEQWPLEIYLQVKPNNFYGQGSWFHYFPRVAYYSGFIVPLLSLFGLPLIWRQRQRFLYLVGFLAYFLAHQIIFHFGLFASGGYSIFLLPLAPALAVAATAGIQVIENQLILRNTAPAIQKRLLYAAIIFLMLYGLFSRPQSLSHEAAVMRETATWLRETHIPQSPVVSTSPWFFYFYGLEWIPPHHWDLPPSPEAMPGGSFFVWDRHYSNRRGYTLAMLRSPGSGWREVRSFRKDVAVVFQKE